MKRTSFLVFAVLFTAVMVTSGCKNRINGTASGIIVKTSSNNGGGGGIIPPVKPLK
ncbi:hypothetical protein [Treponema pedis]|uniref:hypothetical protein n=1 Tax=Treponema pedis TaxID=409322 RepID=UPI0003FF20DB|nr:hypothetical protein [Treponema pedis]